MNIDIRDAYRRSLDDFGRHVQRVTPDQWELDSPCAGWSVHGLVNHLVSETLWAPELLAGRLVPDLGDAFEGDLLGDDPLKVFDSAVAEAVSAAYDEGALTRTVHLSFGDVSG